MSRREGQHGIIKISKHDATNVLRKYKRLPKYMNHMQKKCCKFSITSELGLHGSYAQHIFGLSSKSTNFNEPKILWSYKHGITSSRKRICSENGYIYISINADKLNKYLQTYDGPISVMLMAPPTGLKITT